MKNINILSLQKLTTKALIISLILLCITGLYFGESKITTYIEIITKATIIINSITSIVIIVYFFIKSAKQELKNK